MDLKHILQREVGSCLRLGSGKSYKLLSKPKLIHGSWSGRPMVEVKVEESRGFKNEVKTLHVYADEFKSVKKG